jgi:hypothetical protein
MTLGEKQELFMECLAVHLSWLVANGYKIRGGELQRDPRIAEANAATGAGISNSLHILKLAIDLNLLRNGVMLTDTADHATSGAHWKSLHPLCRWGGDFTTRPDGNHYSVEHNGVR